MASEVLSVDAGQSLSAIEGAIAVLDVVRGRATRFTTESDLG
jgi:hypothetical protein